MTISHSFASFHNVPRWRSLNPQECAYVAKVITDERKKTKKILMRSYARARFKKQKKNNCFALGFYSENTTKDDAVAYQMTD